MKCPRRVPLAADLDRRCNEDRRDIRRQNSQDKRQKNVPNKQVKPTRTSGGFSVFEAVRLR